MDETIKMAVLAVETFLEEGLDAAMGKFNG
jgi:hypothetical protein